MVKDRSFLEIIQDYVENDRVTLPPFDRTALRIQQEIQKGDVQLAKVEKLIIADPALASQILKLANSAFFRGLSKVSTIREAMMRLGLDEITRIVTVLTQSKLYTTNVGFIKKYRNALWQHALVSALVSQWVAREAGFEELVQEVFFASLMHDIGKLFLITAIESIKTSNEIKFMPSITVINEIIRTQHSVQGYNLLKGWNLPEAYCIVARDHHNEKLDITNHLLIILSLVNKTCRKVGQSVDKNDEATVSVASEAGFLGFSDIKLAQLEIQIEDSIKRIKTHYKLGTAA